LPAIIQVSCLSLSGEGHSLALLLIYTVFLTLALFDLLDAFWEVYEATEEEIKAAQEAKALLAQAVAEAVPEGEEGEEEEEGGEGEEGDEVDEGEETGAADEGQEADVVDEVAAADPADTATDPAATDGESGAETLEEKTTGTA
jgi:hypothetical protein